MFAASGKHILSENLVNAPVRDVTKLSIWILKYVYKNLKNSSGIIPRPFPWLYYDVVKFSHN